MPQYTKTRDSAAATASKTNARVGLIIRCSPRNSTATAPPPAFVFASADSAVLAFAPALLARRRRRVRFGRRLVGIVVELDRAIGHQHLAVSVFEVRFGERRRRLARTAPVGVPRQFLAARKIEVVGRAIDRHPGADFIGETSDEDWACAHRITSIAAAKTSARVCHLLGKSFYFSMCAGSAYLCHF